jgi:hypothetical protein
MKLLNNSRIQKQIIALSFVLLFAGISRSIAQQQLSANNNSNVTAALMLGFSGVINSASTSQLTWTMENETSGKWFIIERSNEGNYFDSIGQVVARNNAHDTSYNFVDGHIMMGHNYYRLRMIDNDGVIRYSKIICLDNNDANSAVKMQVYPNPAVSVVNVTLTSAKNEEVSVKIFNLSGILLSTNQARVNAGINQQSIAVGGLKTGNYIIRISGAQGSTEFVQMFSKI